MPVLNPCAERRRLPPTQGNHPRADHRLDHHVLVAVVAVAAQPWKKFDGQEAGLAQILQNVTGSAWPGTVIAAGATSPSSASPWSPSTGGPASSSRCPATAWFRRCSQGQPQNPDTRQRHHRGSRRGGPARRARPALKAGRPDQYRHADGLLRGLRCRDHPATHSARPARGFRVPFYPWVPIASIIFSLLVVIGLPVITFVIFGVWVAAWLVFDLPYGIKHSRLGRQPDEDAPLPQLSGRP